MPTCSFNAPLCGLPAGLDLADRPRHQFVYGTANLVVGYAHALGVEVLADLAKHVVIAGRFDVRDHDLLGIGLRGRAGEAELLRRPQAEQLVAAHCGLELELLVMGKLLLEAFLTLVEIGHAILVISCLVILPRAVAACSAPRPR